MDGYLILINRGFCNWGAAVALIVPTLRQASFFFFV